MFMFLKEAANIKKITPQALYAAIRTKKLKAKKFNSTRWQVNIKDIVKYDKNKYSRELSTLDGELIFNKDKGIVSVNNLAEIYKIPPQRIYYLLRTNKIPAIRKKCSYVINLDDIDPQVLKPIRKKVKFSSRVA